MNDWHWYDMVMFIGCWSLPLILMGLKLYQDRQWEKKFGEKKPK